MTVLTQRPQPRGTAKQGDQEIAQEYLALGGKKEANPPHPSTPLLHHLSCLFQELHAGKVVLLIYHGKMSLKGSLLWKATNAEEGTSVASMSASAGYLKTALHRLLSAAQWEST